MEVETNSKPKLKIRTITGDNFYLPYERRTTEGMISAVIRDVSNIPRRYVKDYALGTGLRIFRSSYD